MSFREVKPTKTNLMSLQKKLNFVLKGKNFLEFKQEQLTFQIRKFWNEYQGQRKKFLKIFVEVMIKLSNTYKEMGKNSFILVSNMSKLQFKPSIRVNYTKRIGNIISIIDYELKNEKKLPPYSFENTSPYLDELITLLKEFFDNLIKLAEIEDLMLKYSLSFKKVNRRINGLKNMIIPNLNIEIKKIKMILEESDRENFVRLKKIKSLINKKNLVRA